MILKRKIYKKLLEWKNECQGKKALLTEGARRMGKSTICEEFGKNEYESYIIHPRNLIVKDGIICIPPYMTMNI
jgi:predicted AAA+ superfamily ATPase